MDSDFYQRVFGESPAKVIGLGGGGNSRVFKVVLGSGKAYAVKEYYPLCADWQARVEAEFGSFQLLRANGIDCVPSPVVRDDEGRAAVYSFEHGEKLGSADVLRDDLKAFASLADDLHKLSLKSELADYRKAKAHCLECSSIESQIELRLTNLRCISANDPLTQLMSDYLEDDFVPLFQKICEWRKEELTAEGLWEYALKQGEWTLSPSDFGLHNALRRKDGSFVFVDFEYFGRDDPAKMVADFLLHPAMNLEAEQCTAAYGYFSEVFSDSYFQLRLKTILPLVGLKWCTIFLNEFFVHGAARREHARGRGAGLDVIREQQLGKSRKLLENINKGYKRFLDVIISQ